MKKHFIFVSTFAVWMLSATMLTSCGDEVITSENNQRESNTGEGLTVFSCGDDATRTTMDENRKFYWTNGDQIWVEKSSGNWEKTFDSKISQDRTTADFYVSEALTKGKYNLVFTGSKPNSADRVTIKNTQSQDEWNNADHIGTSGDCGVAEAERQSGKYTFSLKHKAEYLVFKPYKPDNATSKWLLMSIEITDTDGNALCGTYPFSMNGLDTGQGSSTSNKVTLTLGKGGGLELPNATEAATTPVHCYAVIAPAHNATTRNLKVKYTIKPSISVNGVAGGTFDIVKEFSMTSAPNRVTKIKHHMNARIYSSDIYYMWDAQVGQHYWKGVSNPPSDFGESGTGYATSSSDARFFSTNNNNNQQATRSCANLPNVNALSWYVMAGDPRWDNDGEPWCFDGTGARIYTYGAWLLKWENISGKPAGSTITNCTKSYNGTNYNTTRFGRNSETGGPFTNTSSSYKTAGRPSSSEIDKYFFLPALTCIKTGWIASLSSLHGCYWSSSHEPNNSTIAYSLYFTTGTISVANGNIRNSGLPAVPEFWK